MKTKKRWLGLVCAVVLIFSLIPVSQAAGSFAVVRIDARHLDTREVALHVGLYRRNTDGAFVLDNVTDYSSQINRAAGDVAFYISPGQDKVWVTVDYLTDLNGDGVYELPDGREEPVCDMLSTQGQLQSWTGRQYLTSGQTYRLTAQDLRSRGQAAMAARMVSNGGFLPDGVGAETLYLITLNWEDQGGRQEEQCYYLRLYDRAILPDDVSAGAWYRQGVEYTLDKGLLSGMGENAFYPDFEVSRAQLAQILWRLGGSKEGVGDSFDDVTAGDWYYSAVCWCSQMGLMSGQTDGNFGVSRSLTREQLALILRQYTLYAGLTPTGGQSLTDFTDQESVSSWAREGLEWAMGLGLLSGYEDGTLRPGSGITRAELAAALQRYCQSVLSMP